MTCGHIEFQDVVCCLLCCPRTVAVWIEGGLRGHLMTVMTAADHAACIAGERLGTQFRASDLDGAVP